MHFKKMRPKVAICYWNHFLTAESVPSSINFLSGSVKVFTKIRKSQLQVARKLYILQACLKKNCQARYGFLRVRPQDLVSMGSVFYDCTEHRSKEQTLHVSDWPICLSFHNSPPFIHHYFLNENIYLKFLDSLCCFHVADSIFYSAFNLLT